VSAARAASELPLIEAFGASISQSITSSTILIVGDAPLANGLIIRILRRAGFIDIHMVEGGQAMRRIDALKPDLVLVDSELLELDRIALCVEIRADPRFANLPIIVQTELGNRVDGPTLFAIKVSDILVKPINPNELVTRVANHLERVELLRELRQYHDRTREELGAARRMQLDLLPPLPLQHGMAAAHGLRAATFYRPSSEIGGDVWGVLPIDQDSFGIFLIDFAGHGVTAALNVFRLHALVLELKALHRSPSALLARLNDALLPILPRGQFATFLYVVIDMAESRLRLASAGAPPPVLRPADGSQPTLLDSAGIPLGVMQGPHYQQHEHRFDPGAMLLMFSDGLTEFPDENGDRIGEDGLLPLIDRCEAGLAPDEVVTRVREAAGIDVDGVLPDDTMIICIDRELCAQRRRA
jgi:sigma-B regulation protein RsbU (phosphoserine phosphatase)